MKENMRKAYGETLQKLGERNPNIVVLDADLSHSTKTCMFAEKFPDRFFNMGIAEQNMIGTAAGLSSVGKIPFASSFTMFAIERAFEQIRNSVAYSNLNVNIVSTHAGITVGKDGSSHQPLEDIALMRSLPNMRVMVPSDAVETRAMVKDAAERSGPDYIRLSRTDAEVVHEGKYEFSEKAEIIRDGKDVAIIACGLMVEQAIIAAEELKHNDIDVAVINMKVIKPLDIDTVVKYSKSTNGIVSVEEHSIIGGLGGAICEVVSERSPCPVRRVGIKDRFGESGNPHDLLRKYGLTSLDIISEVTKVVDGRTEE